MTHSPKEYAAALLILLLCSSTTFANGEDGTRLTFERAKFSIAPIEYEHDGGLRPATSDSVCRWTLAHPPALHQ